MPDLDELSKISASKDGGAKLSRTGNGEGVDVGAIARMDRVLVLLRIHDTFAHDTDEIRGIRHNGEREQSLSIRGGKE